MQVQTWKDPTCTPLLPALPGQNARPASYLLSPRQVCRYFLVSLSRSGALQVVFSTHFVRKE